MNKALALWDRIEETLCIVLFVLLIIFSFSQVLSRYELVPFSLDWADELSRYTFIALVYVAASLAIAKNRHVRVEVIDFLLPKKYHPYLALATDLVWLAFTLALVRSGAIVAIKQLKATTPVLQWNMGHLYFIIPICFFMMALRLCQRIVGTLLAQKGGAS
jgi:TRAP-type C4-dicarboxylate transport system permease small subunit